MPDIRTLPSSVVNKIAAGEVIERAASVVKELMENSLDAGARRIDVLVEAGGTELIRVTDDGCGIVPEQLPLAIASHATSKLRDADDLFRVGTLGFRGEALASMAEVSRLLLRSRTAAAPSGAELEVVAGKAAPVVPHGMPVGTTLEIRDLFFNTPVRRKFLKSPQTESGHVAETFTRLALAHPQVHFTLRQGSRLAYDLPPAADCLERIGCFFGKELVEQLIDVDSRDPPIRLHGYVAHPSQSRSHPRMQYLFLNGRFIRDRALQHALGEAYRGLLLGGRYPIAFLWLDLPAELVDVNVHPTKLEVRFQDGGRLYSQLLGTLRTRFLTTDLTTRLSPAAAAGSVAAPWSAALPIAAEAGLPTSALLRTNALAPGSLAPQLPPATASPPSYAAPVSAGSAGPVSAAVPALQIHNRYLVAESAEGVVVIDQHALHERILYEQLKARVLQGSFETQTLLVPEPVDLSSAELAMVLEQQPLLLRLGLAVEAFGGETVLIRSYPAMLANLRPADVLRGLVDQLLSSSRAPDRRDLLDELLHGIACKAAIKAGDRLTPAEIATLLEQRHQVQDTHHCPHGRPTELVFTREDLDRQFKRT